MNLKLFVYLIGGHSCQVTIDWSESVSSLKEAITEKYRNQLKGFDANALNLFQVSFPDSGNPQELENSAREALISTSIPLTMASSLLSEIFKEPPPRKTVSIVVTSPDTNLSDLDDQMVKKLTTIQVPNLNLWTALGESDLRYNKVRCARPPSKLRVRERLQHLRYINTGSEDVRAVLPWCRLT
ncbi:hypothetical protein F5148DRAFT_464732 [Russula earlei]|uniref:Uncharacterized protein n=1 Tax=Russula earlei TaxID=71964 RepID=A0ACC0UN26_9AGAM|nr:hypothetical protein F5148DRAFT_464732 [Russula earlei]